MRVRISYSVELEDVPEECSRMLQEAASKVNEVYEEIETLVDQLNSGSAVPWRTKDYIARCRKKLAQVDAVLGDNEMILDGFFKSQEPQPQDEVSDVDQG